MKKPLLMLLGALIALPAMAADGDDFQFSYQGQTLTYTVISEADKTVKTKDRSSDIVQGDLILPEKVQNNGSEYTLIELGEYAFFNNKDLTSVEIPNSVTKIGDNAFALCNGLTSITIPNSVTEIGEMAFYQCNRLEKVVISDLKAWCNIKFSSNPLSNAKHLYLGDSEITELVIPDGVTSINDLAFNGCSGLKSVTIPDFVTEIGSGAFSGCTGLTEIDIPNSVTEIGSGAFSGCESLTQVKLPNTLTFIPDYLFSSCYSLTEIDIPESVTKIGQNVFYQSGLTSIIIPNSVTEIGPGAFVVCRNLTHVELSNSLSTIASGLFNGSGLTHIDIPNSVTEIGPSAFEECTSLKSVTIGNGVKSIRSGAFNECTSLTEINIPNSVTEIGYIFYNCKSLKSIIIPNSVTRIDGGAFSYCTGLTEIDIPNSVTEIADGAFYYCTGLTSIIIPAGCIGTSECSDWGAFRYCDNLKTVTLGADVTELGQYAFYNDPLETIYSTSLVPPTAYSYTFRDYTAELHVCADAVDAYKSTEPWSNFTIIGDIIEPESLEIETTEIRGNEGDTFDLGSEVTLLPVNTTFTHILWQSSNHTIATVDNNGLVTLHVSTSNPQAPAKVNAVAALSDEDSLACEITAKTLHGDLPMATAVVKFDNDSTSSVENIAVDDSSEMRSSDIFNLQGVCLKRGASQADIDALAPGLYIIAGKKVLVK